MTEDHVPVNIPKELYEEIEKRVAESEGEFKNVEEYVEFVLTEVLKEDESSVPIFIPHLGLMGRIVYGQEQEEAKRHHTEEETKKTDATTL